MTATIALPKLFAIILLLAALGGAALLLPWPGGPGAPPPVAAQTTTDYDADDDGLIDINNLDQLNAIRWDLDGNGYPAAANTSSYLAAFPNRDTDADSLMGCPAGACTGYELMQSLTFSTSTGDPHTPWTPIGADTNAGTQFRATFDGNGNTLTGMSITSGPQGTGLFGSLGPGGVIRDLGMINASVASNAGSNRVGILAGYNRGSIMTSYAQGGTSTAGTWAGGLVGNNSDGTITASYSTATIYMPPGTSQAFVGGLAGGFYGGRITASYSAGNFIGSPGPSGYDGGIAGITWYARSRMINSYCDATNGPNSCTDLVTSGAQAGNLDATATSTAALQAPTGYEGIYANWNLDVTGDGYEDDPWDFGTTSTYPTLKHPSQRTPAPAAYIDYDTDDNGLIEVGSLAQLDAIRHDLDGNGAPASTTAYEAGFPTPIRIAAGRMGCPNGQCRGYELTASLTFPASGMHSTWTPIGVHGGASFSAVFDGRGNTLTDLKIDRSGGDTVHAGLFRQVAGGGVIRNLGLLNPAVTSTMVQGGRTGALVGTLNAGGRIETSYASGGRIRTTGESTNSGGLVGESVGVIIASYATVEVAADTTEGSVYAGGLVGYMSQATANITASYAAGQVTGTNGNASSELSGLAGAVYTNATVTASYCDNQVSTKSVCVGDTGSGMFAAGTVEATPTTTSALQAPTGYTGIYADWNVDTDGNFVIDYAWNFGGSGDYPVLYTPAQREPLIPRIDYDANDNGLIDISTTAQLDAIREDANGNGDANTSTYAAAFPDRHTSRTTRMGCPGGACTGYELTADLTFGATSTWAPFRFNAVLEGNGHTITGININVADGDAGMFGSFGANARIRDLGLIDFNVTSTRTGVSSNGILVGYLPNAVPITGVYALGGSISVSTDVAGGNVGGLVGFCRPGCTLTASYSTAAVAIIGGSEADRHAGGLVGRCDGCAIVASYAAGLVTSTASVTLTNIGGLTGSVSGAASVITDSYCDTQTTGQTDCDGNPLSSATATSTGYTTSQLQTPTNYTGIYASWNVDLDGDSSVDYPWDFGANNQYPRLLTPAQRLVVVPGNNDYDLNDNGLIDISNRAQLDAIRHDLDGDGEPANPAGYGVAFPNRNTTSSELMGCPAGTCTGYELTADLTFASSSRWTPIVNFGTTLDGAGHTITGVNINVGATGGDAGLFGGMTASATVRDLGLIDFSVTSTRGSAGSNGILAGYVEGAAAISRVSVQGGRLSVATDGVNTSAGGLVGYYAGSITASYSTAAVSLTAGTEVARHAGGLVGRCVGCAITASYAAGPVTSTVALNNIGGLTGSVTNNASAITNSYCDTEGTGQSDCDGNVASGVAASAAGHTTAQMQNPTGYTGIYRDWNLDPDGNGHPNYPWNFGGVTDYPMLNTPDQRDAAAPALTDYDVNDNNLIDVSSIAQLHAMRWDLDGDGDPDAAADALPYSTAFGGRTTSTPNRMGCPATCAGYELAAPLAFPAATTSAYNPWTPIADFNTAFDGRGRTISGVNVNVTTAIDAGLFGSLAAAATVQDLGLINVNVTSTSPGAQDSGTLAGQVAAGAVVTAVYADGGRVAVSTNQSDGGGLVGELYGELRAVWSTAAVTAGGSPTNLYAGGLVGRRNGGTISASYAAGSVATTTGNATVGGLVAISVGSGGAINQSYCDTGAAGQPVCIGVATGAAVAAPGYSAAQLQTPTDYTGIYIHWGLDLDGDDAPDYPWDFGTSGDYPMLNTPAQRTTAAPAPMDYDVNNNGLIDISSLDQLYAMRYDLDGDGHPESGPAVYSTIFAGRDAATSTRMGCPAGACAGYELTASLTFPASAGAHNPWTPVGDDANPFNTTFDGVGRTLTGMNVTGTIPRAGLFGTAGASSTIRDLGLINATVAAGGDARSGVLVGQNAGLITASYAQGGSVLAAANDARAGGLVGSDEGGVIIASYSTAAVSIAAGSPVVAVGGLVGALVGGQITAAYAAGPVTGTGATGTVIGGFAGLAWNASSTITDSYCDTTVTTRNMCIQSIAQDAVAGNLSATATGTAILQAPTGYAGPYLNWNVDLDDNGSPDYPWNFGTASQYPTLNSPAQRLALAPDPVDYDANDNNLIDIGSILQLNAIRYDLDGDGDPARANRGAYNTAFPGRVANESGRMGCPAACVGYELTMSLTFPAETSSEYNPWTPVDQYAAEFNGQGLTLTGLNLNQSASGGLFGAIAASGTIRDLGLINPTVTITGAGGENAGALAGFLSNGANIETSYVDGGSVTVAGGSARAGGLVGQNNGRIQASYSTAAVSATGAPTGLRLGGLVGFGLNGQIIASYAAGAVTPGSATGQIGGLIGRSEGGNDTVTNGFCDTAITMQANCVGAAESGSIATSTAPGFNTAALQTPTGYTGIYLNWNLDLDGDLNLDYPWNFGSASQHPTLYTPTQRARQVPADKDYDDDDNNLIDIRTLDELNAMRWDTDGDGHPEAANFGAYGMVFPGRTATATGRMGCPAGCTGYELRASLTFPTEGPYANWTGINNFATTFDGNGHTLTGLTVNSADYQGGLFRHVFNGGHIKNLGIIEPNIRVTLPEVAGGLAATLHAGARIDASYVAGGRVVTADNGGNAGGLVGSNRGGIIRASYSTAAVAAEGARIEVSVGGLVGYNDDGTIIASYAAGPVTGLPGTDNDYGGLVGWVPSGSSNITLSYCDSEISPQTGSNCIGYTSSNPGVVQATATSTQVLQSPTDYTGIYAGWNLDLSLPADGVNDNPWQFARGSYPRLAHQSRAQTDSPPPGGPRQAQPPQDTPYNPAADHPEVYENDRYEMSATCDVKRNADGLPETSTITFNLGNYQGQVILHLAQWNGQYFTSYESLGIDLPTFERDGQMATVRVTTNPTQTRFLLDSISPTTNLVLGYADCHTDDDTGVLVTPGTAAAAETPAETAETSTPADAETPAETAETSTPPTPKVYTNDRYEMTASCDVRNNAEGQPESSLITFDLGRYEATVILSISLWNGEYYASLESHSLPEPSLVRDGQMATVLVTTNPAETRFLLDGTPNGLRTNLLLGYADCHTAGE